VLRFRAHAGNAAGKASASATNAPCLNALSAAIRALGHADERMSIRVEATSNASMRLDNVGAGSWRSGRFVDHVVAPRGLGLVTLVA
jgi:hypothetical protein